MIVELWHNQQESWLKKTDEILTGKEELVVKPLFSHVSLGTERLLITERIALALADNMRVPFMKGSFRENFTYGYSMVGQVESEQQGLNNKLVHLMHPHQSLAIADFESVHFIPEGIDPRLATLASNMETAVTAVWDAEIEIGDKVLIIGYGTVGALIAVILQNIAGTEVQVLEENEKRVSSISQHGFQLYDDRIADSSFDVVINTSSSQEMLQNALRLTKNEGKVVELSWYGNKGIEIKLGTHFHYGRKRIISSQVSQIPHRKQPDWNFIKRKELVFKLLKKLNPEYLIESEIPFSASPFFYKRLRSGQIDEIGVIIKY